MDGPLGPLEPARAPLEPVNLRRERHAKFPEVQRRSPAATLTLFLLLTFFAIASGTNPHDCRRYGHERLSLVVPWIPQVISPDLNLNDTCLACGATCQNVCFAVKVLTVVLHCAPKLGRHSWELWPKISLRGSTDCALWLRHLINTYSTAC